MRKIATITFHWAVNYGAVLQAYALQKYLLLRGVQTQIIDYVPRRSQLGRIFFAIKKRDRLFFKKRKRLRDFCEQELKMSKKTYRSNRALFDCADHYDAVICGSDQIWNENFTNGAEGKPTFSYYLNFVGKNTKKIAYAVSFGTTKLAEHTQKNIAPHVKAFDRIAVRENSGKEILKELGVNATVTVDPTLLLTSDIYESLFENRNFAPANKVFSYILHDGQITAQKVCRLVQRHFGEKEQDGCELSIDLRQWLHDLAKSEFVVTNSFHGSVFALIFHRPFVVLPVENSGMNDRIQTLMSAFGLCDRIVTSEAEAQAVLQKPIDWETVDTRLLDLRANSEQYLSEVI